MSEPFTFGTLFSGGGIADIGLVAAGGTPAFAVEREEEIARVYAANLGKHVLCRPVEDVNINRLKQCDIDLLSCSPPCQGDSCARDKNLPSHPDEAAGIHILRYTEQLKPRVVIVENVPQYLHNPVFLELVAGLTQQGYMVDYQVLNAASLGVPQTRKRLILRALLKSAPGFDIHKFRLPARTHWRGWYGAIEDLIPALPESQFAPWQLKRLPDYLPGSFYSDGLNAGRREYIEDDADLAIRTVTEPAYTVQGKAGGHRAFIVHGSADNERFVTREDKKPCFTVTGTSSSPRAYLVDDQYGAPATLKERPLRVGPSAEPAFSVMASASCKPKGWLESGKVVKMTPRCLARFQTIPDWYELPASNPLTSRIIGNALPAEMVRRIAEGLL